MKSTVNIFELDSPYSQICMHISLLYTTIEKTQGSKIHL